MITSIIIGGIAGWLASLVMKTDEQMGIFLNIVIGVVGGWIGGFIFDLFSSQPSGWFGDLVVGFIGAIILIAIVKAIRR